MFRYLVQSVTLLIANICGLKVASVMLDGFRINSVSFVLAVVVLTLNTIIMMPFILNISLKGSPLLVAFVTLLTTFVGLIVTDLFSEGMSIAGITIIIASTLIVWLFSLFANVLLPYVIFKPRKSDKNSTVNK